MVKDLIKLEVSLSMGDHDNAHKASSIIVLNFPISPNSIININIVKLDFSDYEHETL